MQRRPPSDWNGDSSRSSPSVSTFKPLTRSDSSSPVVSFSPTSASFPMPSSGSSHTPSLAYRPGGTFQRKSSGQSLQTMMSMTTNGRPQRYQAGRPGTLSPPVKRRQAHAPTGEQDWGHMDPDDVFRKLSVPEVKKVEGILRNEAESKQGDLRSMVSERYRDLLLSTTQISTLHKSSLRLSRVLRNIDQACTQTGSEDAARNEGTLLEIQGRIHDAELLTDQFKGKSANGERKKPSRSNSGLDEDLEAKLPAAAKMKLLLDAPDAVYTLLASQSYLEATFLWSLARTVKEDLLGSSSGKSSDASEEQDLSSSNAFAPLVVSQWEVLLPFRNQIITQAKDALRKERKVKGPVSEEEETTIAKTLVALILLGSNTLAETADIFLQQRSRLLQDVQSRFAADISKVQFAVTLATGAMDRRVELNGAADRSRPHARHSRQPSRLNAAEVLRELSPGPQKEKARSLGGLDYRSGPETAGTASRRGQTLRTARAFSEYLTGLSDTMMLSRALFVKDGSTSGKEGAIQRIVTMLQNGDVRRTGTPSALKLEVANGHARRFSRLPSMHDNASLTGAANAATDLTAGDLIRKLPASPVLLRFLPPAIRHFTPFIGSSSMPEGSLPAAINSRLEAWLTESLVDLKRNGTLWLDRLPSIRDVERLRVRLASLLDLTTGMLDGKASAEYGRIREAVNACCSKRVEALWRAKLEILVQDGVQGLDSALTALRSDDSIASIEFRPSRLVFGSPIEFPLPLNSKGKSHHVQEAFANQHLPAFRRRLKQLLAKRTPYMDQLLGRLETEALSLAEELATVPSTDESSHLRQACLALASDAYARLLQGMRSQFDRLGVAPGDQVEVDLAVFVARVVIQLAPGTAFCRALTPGYTDDTLDSPDITAMVDFAMSAWRTKVSERFRLQAVASPADGRSLDWAISSVLDLGLPLQCTRDAGSYHLLPQTTGTEEAHNDSGEGDLPGRSDVTGLPAGSEHANSAVSETIKRAQLLFQPLLQNSSKEDFRGAQDERILHGKRNALLLPFFMAPSSQTYVSPIDLAKPCARFGQISLA